MQLTRLDRAHYLRVTALYLGALGSLPSMLVKAIKPGLRART